MMTIVERNVNAAYATAVRRTFGSTRSVTSRNGEMREFRTPVVTTYTRPKERVLFDPIRDCNPYLHFFEALWVLAGRKDVGFLATFTGNYLQFSEDGVELRGAYGYRLREWFGEDQIITALEMLRADPFDRRVVLSLWDPHSDLLVNNKGVRDIPCNTQIFPRIRGGELSLTVMCRSNDMLWGCYGANQVVFSFLLEYMADKLDVEVGSLTQVSNSLHYYPNFDVAKRVFGEGSPPSDVNHYGMYQAPRETFPLGASHSNFDRDLHNFFCEYDEGQERASGKIFTLNPTEYHTPFFREVVAPFWNSFVFYQKVKMREGEKLELMDYMLRAFAQSIGAWDWKQNVGDWLSRRTYELCEKGIL